MEITNIETLTFETVMAKVEIFAKKVDKLCTSNGDKTLQEWLDNQEVCAILHVSKRTLQTYRDNGTLSYSQIGHKMYYRSEDVRALMDKLKTK